MPPPARTIDPSTTPRRSMIRATRRRSRQPLEQIPVWTDPIGERPGPASTPGSSGLDGLLGGLNADQLRAVTHGEGPLLIVAGAGTGKTQVVTRRIAWLIATRRARPSEILALTFTDKAAAEMQARVDRLVPYGYTDTAIATFHAFGDRLIREYALELGLAPDVRVLSRPEVVIFLRERLFDFELERFRPLGDPTRFLGALAGHFSRLKDEDIDPATYLAEADREVGAAALLAELADETEPDDDAREAAAAAVEAAARQLELARAFVRYQALLGEAGFIDFGDQVALALRLVRESAAARNEIRQRFQYVLVDEFQDTNRAQSELVELIAAPARNLTVVGDDDQSIYRFRGAAMTNIVEFRDRPGRPRVIVLRRNYRSRAGILEASHRLIRFNDPDRLEVRAGIDKRLRAQRAEPPPEHRPAAVRHEAFETGAEEAEWVAREIAGRVARGAAPRDHAILIRTNAEADPILRSLNVAGLPWRFSGTSGLYARPEVRLLLSFLRAVADLGSSVDVYALAASDVYGLGGEDLTDIVAAARRRNRTVWEVLDEVDRQPGILRLAPATRTAASRLVADLRRYSELGHARPAGEVLYAFLRDSGLLARYAAAGAASEEALLNVARFFDIVRAQSALLADDRCAFLAGHLQTLIEAGDDPPTADLDGDADAVAVLTVHKAKGLEFPTVFLVGLVDGRFPSGGRRDPLAIPSALLGGPQSEGDLHRREERRLFYVGMTRARDELILSHAADYGGRRARRVSPFVLEALDLPDAEAVSLGAGRHAAERLAGFESSAVPVEPVRRPTGEPLTLSFGQVDAYLTCPLRYRYGHVVRVPVAPHHALVYGSALHRAVQEFHRRQGRAEIMTEAQLEAAFEAAWMSEGFLTREHEEARLTAGKAALRRFRAEQLLPGSVVPTYVERDFSFSLDGDRVRGRWDRVDVEPIPAGTDHAGLPAAASEPATGGSSSADVVEPTLPLLPRERVTITDYKSSDVRDPVKARQRARDSLQLTIYAMGYEAMTGRLPDAVQLHYLETGVVGRAAVDEKRLAKGRERIALAAAGIRARAFEPTPSVLACTYCPYRDICPASAVR